MDALSTLATDLAATAAGPSGGTVGMLLSGMGVLAAVVVYLDRRSESRAEAARLREAALHAENNELRAAALTTVLAHADRLVELQRQHTEALMGFQDVRFAGETATREQLVHLVRQCAAVLTATGASIDAVQETNAELVASHRELTEAVHAGAGPRGVKPR